MKIGGVRSKVAVVIAVAAVYNYIQRLINKKNKNVLGPIPTNLFLFFAAK